MGLSLVQYSFFATSNPTAAAFAPATAFAAAAALAAALAPAALAPPDATRGGFW